MLFSSLSVSSQSTKSVLGQYLVGLQIYYYIAEALGFSGSPYVGTLFFSSTSTFLYCNSLLDFTIFNFQLDEFKENLTRLCQSSLTLCLSRLYALSGSELQAIGHCMPCLANGSESANVVRFLVQNLPVVSVGKKVIVPF